MTSWARKLTGQSDPAPSSSPNMATSRRDKAVQETDTVPGNNQPLVQKSLETKRNHNGSISWGGFNHQQGLILGYSNSTFIAYPKNLQDGNPSEYVLKSCALQTYSPEKLRLVDLARAPSGSNFFLGTLCVFEFGTNLYVGSELSDISLEDIIHSTVDLAEHHLAAILGQVISAMSYFHERTREAGVELVYNSLQASNVFLKRNGKVQLASFGSRINPQRRSHTNGNRDVQCLGDLAIHMITRSSEQPENRVLRQKMLSGNASGRGLDASFEPSPEFLDFYEMCFANKGDMRKLLKVYFP
jgi:hypothetical protein